MAEGGKGGGGGGGGACPHGQQACVKHHQRADQELRFAESTLNTETEEGGRDQRLILGLSKP